MSTGDYHYSQLLPSNVPKRRRTHRRHASPLSDFGLTQDEKDCIFALLDLSRAPLIHDEKMTPAEEERSLLSPPEVEERSQSLSSPSSTPPKQQQELSPISLPSQSTQNQPLPPPPPAKRDLPSLPSQHGQPLPPPPPQAERVLPSLPPQQNQPPPPLPVPVQAPSLVLCPVPLGCYPPPLPPPIQQPSPFVFLAPAKHNQARYECPECSRVFSSYQALGGHKASHRKHPAENCAAASAAVVTGATEQTKPHTCSLCHKSFATGQALGGHMSAHYKGIKRQDTAERRPVAAPSSWLTECSTAVGLGIDLNQAATPEEEWTAEEKVVSSHPPAAATCRPLCFISFF